ncbi:MAG: hypothetical protein ABI806_22405 [Candidatus Solibacter sp.]
MAWMIGTLQMIHPVGWGFGRGFEMSSIAKSLAADGTYADPFAPFKTGPTAVVPPLYPLAMGAVYKLAPGPAGGVVLTVGNILSNAAIAALLPWLAVVLCGQAAPGIFAGLLWLGVMRLMPQWDTSFTLTALILFVGLTARGGRSWRWALASGVAAGGITLANPAAVLILGLWMMYLLWDRVSWSTAFQLLTIFGVAVLAVNTPWLVRNYRIWHALVVRSNFGMTLYASNIDCAESTLQKAQKSGCYDAAFPVDSANEVAWMQQLGEVKYDRERGARAMQWIRSHPRRFAELTASRALEYWFPPVEAPAHTFYAIWLVTLLSLPGLVLMARDGLRSVWVMSAICAVYPLMYYVVVSLSRYRYPIIWTSLIPAGYFLWVVSTRISRPGLSRPDSARQA